MPCSDLDDELPLYCVAGNDCPMVMWGNGKIMSTDEWNSYYDQSGNLIDPDKDPSANNPGWVGHKNRPVPLNQKIEI
jgi:hypothetical protein